MASQVLRHQLANYENYLAHLFTVFLGFQYYDVYDKNNRINIDSLCNEKQKQLTPL